jgi:hypothetical protein
LVRCGCLLGLPAGGLPWLQLLTRLEFYLPDERNWGECYVNQHVKVLFVSQVLLGEVWLPEGGLPWLPLLTRLEFNLPDERNWGERYVM